MLKHFVVLSLVSFFLHLIWEYVQCPLFYLHGSLKPTHTAMLIATVGDVGITWLLYALLALYRKHWTWSLDQWRVTDLLLIEGLSLGVATSIEIRALDSGKWSYTPNTPLVPGTSVSFIPLLQLALLVPVSIFLARSFIVKPVRSTNTRRS